jgi:hypothetical protein
MAMPRAKAPAPIKSRKPAHPSQIATPKKSNKGESLTVVTEFPNCEIVV